MFPRAGSSRLLVVTFLILLIWSVVTFFQIQIRSATESARLQHYHKYQMEIRTNAKLTAKLAQFQKLNATYYRDIQWHTRSCLVNNLTTYYYPRPASRQLRQRGKYSVVINFLEGEQAIPYNETVTLATHATLEYINHLPTLVNNWDGPISLAVHTPGTDFLSALNDINRFYNCIGDTSRKIKNQVTFHFIMDYGHEPHGSPSFKHGIINYKLPSKVNCEKVKHGAPTSVFNKKESYRQKNNLLYPINMARNIAKEQSHTHYILVSDIELLPNPKNFTELFLKMVNNLELKHEYSRDGRNMTLSRQVFVLPPFEVLGTSDRIPRTKQSLVKMIEERKAQTFHRNICAVCHRLQNETDWIYNNDTSMDLGIFSTTPYYTSKAWEPFYVGTMMDPPFDERIYREYKLNKVVQVLALCELNYKFHILNRAYLVHATGLDVWEMPSMRSILDETLPPEAVTSFSGHC